MQFNINTVTLLAALLPLASAVPSEVTDNSLAKRQRQYQCETSNKLGACNNAVGSLSSRQKRWIWKAVWALTNDPLHTISERPWALPTTSSFHLRTQQ
ncbi:hypothetical protein BDP81DRAFT_436883 [Colletotrichum phormii]|uniref:Uncharacterized protein n=1 Tax=Colletotrichum phormii TaxID=359342 RepID=A0AAI9ZI36_9PEZI|nr:uncharacterized protein BDP81DRAFT_436883 [Colletotrichum phormii]KAK1624980.1 hypothetical protein BDP81DRAFT_436883 [Colletotrichum phormii]